MLPRALEPLKRLGLDEHLWSDLAPVLDDVLAGRGDPYPVGELSETVVGGVAHAARAAGVRTWGMSMLTALDYARALVAETPVTNVGCGLQGGPPPASGAAPGRPPDRAQHRPR